MENDRTEDGRVKCRAMIWAVLNPWSRTVKGYGTDPNIKKEPKSKPVSRTSVFLRFATKRKHVTFVFLCDSGGSREFKGS